MPPSWPFALINMDPIWYNCMKIIVGAAVRHFKYSYQKELWEGIIPFSFVKNGPVYDMLEKIWKEVDFLNF